MRGIAVADPLSKCDANRRRDALAFVPTLDARGVCSAHFVLPAQGQASHRVAALALCLVLLCGLASFCSAEQKIPLAVTPDWSPQDLPKLELALEGIPYADRCRSAPEILAAAAAAHSLGAEAASDWRQRLYGDDTDAAAVFRVFGQVFVGEYRNVLKLYRPFSRRRISVNWAALAEWLEAAKDSGLDQVTRDDAAAVLHFLAARPFSLQRAQPKSSAQKLSQARKEVRQKLASLLVSASETVDHRVEVRGMCGMLRWAFMYGWLTDPLLGAAVAKLTPHPERRRLLQERLAVLSGTTQPDAVPAEAQRQLFLGRLAEGSAKETLGWLQTFRGETLPEAGGGAMHVITAAAVSAMLHPHAATEWGERLYGENADLLAAFAGLLDIMHGRYQPLLSVVAALRRQQFFADWGAVACLLKDAAGQVPSRRKWRDAATAACLLALMRGDVLDSPGLQAMAAFSAGPESVRKAVCAAFAAAAREQKQYWVLASRVESFLNQALWQQKLTDPVLAELLVELTPYASWKQTLAGRLESAGLHGQAERAHELALRDAPMDPEVVIRAFRGLLRLDRAGRAVGLMRQAERNLPYPGRRRVRFYFLSWLALDARRVRAISRTGGHLAGVPAPRHGVGGVPSLEQEKRARVQAAQLSGSVDALFGLGDLYAATGRRDEASEHFTAVLGQSEGAAVKYAAWLALAEISPETAWEHAAEMRKLCQSTNSLGDVRILAEKFFIVGVAAGDLEGAIACAAGSLGDGTKAEARLALKATIVAAHLHTAGLERARELARGFHRDDLLTGANEVFLMLGKGELGIGDRSISPELRRCADRRMVAGLEPSMLWILAACSTCDGVPSLKLPHSTPAAWAQIVRCAPHVQSDTVRELLLHLTDVCLAWVDKEEVGAQALPGFIEAAAGVLRSASDGGTLATASRLFAASLKRAHAHGVAPEKIKPWVRSVLVALETKKTSADAVVALKEAVARYYPQLVKARQ